MKTLLRQYADRRLCPQLDERLGAGTVHAARARFVGQWEWWVRMESAEGAPVVDLVFGPTAVVFNEAVQEPIARPDYRRVFLHLPANADRETARLIQTDVDLAEVLAGLSAGDARLAESIAGALQQE